MPWNLALVAPEACPSTPCHAPSDAEYRDAVVAIEARWPAVRTITPGNEPNHPAQPTY